MVQVCIFNRKLPKAHKASLVAPYFFAVPAAYLLKAEILISAALYFYAITLLHKSLFLPQTYNTCNKIVTG